MKLNLLLLMCSMALILVGCTGECAKITLDYYFINATDKTIEVEAYDDDGHNPVEVHYSFSIPPHGEFIISGKYFPGRDAFFPFNYSDYVRISNGEKVVIQDYDSDHIDCLFKLDCYEAFSCNKRKTSCYRYTFTEGDFERGTPVTEE